MLASGTVIPSWPPRLLSRAIHWLVQDALTEWRHPLQGQVACCPPTAPWRCPRQRRPATRTRHNPHQIGTSTPVPQPIQGRFRHLHLCNFKRRRGNLNELLRNNTVGLPRSRIQSDVRLHHTLHLPQTGPPLCCTTEHHRQHNLDTCPFADLVRYWSLLCFPFSFVRLSSVSLFPQLRYSDAQQRTF